VQFYIIFNIFLELIKQLTQANNTIKLLKNELKELKETVNKDSSNSSKPPSTDNYFNKKKDIKKNNNKNRSRGGQKGNTNNNLKKVNNPDKIEILQIDNCLNCNSNLENVEAKSISKKQVFDIPKIKIEVTEFQQHNKVCPCCNIINKPKFPKNITSYVQYGDNIKTFVAYLNTYQMIPYARISELMKDFTSHSISSGTIYNMLESFYEKLEPYEKNVKNLLINSNVVNVDETGAKVKNKLHWIHTVSTSSLTYYMIHEKRGAEAIDFMGILPEFNGVAVHDHWASYNKYDCLHSYCNAHHLRELVGVIANEKVFWAKDMHKLLTDMNNYFYKLKEKGQLIPSKEEINQFFKKYDYICQEALEIYPPPSKKREKQSKSKNLLDRFIKYKYEILRFFTNPLVPFTNNLAERDLRMIKVKEKISGCFASLKGAHIFNRIRGYISTVKKNNKSVPTP